MSIDLVEGFDHTNSDALLASKGWTVTNELISEGFFTYTQTARVAGNGYSIGINRTGGAANDRDNSLTKVITSDDGLYFGAGVVVVGVFYSSLIIEFLDTATSQIGVRFNTDRTLSVVRGGWGGTVLATTAWQFTLGSWFHLQFQCKIANSGGWIKLWINGELIIDTTGLDTQNTANASANRIYLKGSCATQSGQYVRFDDLYSGNEAGSLNTAPIGDAIVATLFPTAAGANTAWTPSAGSNYQNVDEVNADGDTTYNYTSTLNNKDTYTYGNLPATAALVFAIQINPYLRKDDAVARACKSLMRVGSTNYQIGADKYLSTSYLYYPALTEIDPSDSLQPTVADVNGAEFGVEVTV